MGISIVRYSENEYSDPAWGVLEESIIYPLEIGSDHHRDVIALYNSNRAEFESAISDFRVEASSVEYLSPLSQEIQLVAQGMNYASHRAEGQISGKEKTESGHFQNSIFYKASSSISKPNETIIRPKDCKLLDYEIEFGIVLKKGITEEIQVTDSNVSEYIGGLVLMNDVSARDTMFGAPVLQWYRGKSHRTFCPTGPVLYLLDEDEISKMYSLRLKLRLNGKVMQSATSDQLIHRPPEILSDISTLTNLNIGDCILTGTPGGVLFGMNLRTALAMIFNLNNDQKRREKIVAAQLARTDYLAPGDVLELEIVSSDGTINLGKQRNEIIAA